MVENAGIMYNNDTAIQFLTYLLNQQSESIY